MGFRIIWRKFVTIPNLATNQHPALMAASRLLGAAAACLILLSFAAGHRKSYWSGSIKAAIVICQQIFAILALVIFLVKIPCKKKVLQNRLFFALASRSGFGAAISDAVARISSIGLCNSACANRIVMAASRLLVAAAAYVILLFFAAGHRKSYWRGCIKAAITQAFITLKACLCKNLICVIFLCDKASLCKSWV